MHNFFNPGEHAEIMIPMYGTIHIITLLLAVLFVILIIWKKNTVKKLVTNRRFMLGLVVVYMSIDLLYWILIWAFKVEPRFERFPLHLCASLSILMPVLILIQKYNWFRFFSYWSVCAGFISLINPSFIHDAAWSFAFIHYLIRHGFLFLIPIIIQIGMEFNHRYREFLLSCAVLASYGFLIFLLDWITGANYMHLGRNNPLEIPFLPENFTKWPWSYPSFVGVGIILMHLTYLGLALPGRKKRFGPQTTHTDNV